MATLYLDRSVGEVTLQLQLVKLQTAIAKQYSELLMI